MPLVRDVWSDHSPTHHDVVRALDDVLDGLRTKWPAWRTDRLEAGHRIELPPTAPTRDALDLARRTAVDHQ
jgi:hypothetical protein